ncbi:MAG TPA: hypothetical protein VMT45_13865 [Thermoanaerobaculaceae bacterium]|nr:hypothetical protein [Thermoanaerobaculaceae bacterium]
MPNFARILKDEISRIARREAGAAVDPVRKPTRALRRTAADLRRKLGELEREVRALRKAVAALSAAAPSAAPTGAQKIRITAKGVRSLRRRLRLNGQEFARLLGVTGQVVYGWEKASGPLRVRERTRAAILAARELGARGARRRLEETRKAASARKPRRKRAKRG